MYDNKELKSFNEKIVEEVKAQVISDEDGAVPVQLFTENILEMLSDAGETENYRSCYDEKVTKRGVEHQINGYALYENYETLDLFITIYSGSDEVQSINKADLSKSFNRLEKFFRNAVYGDYVNLIEESSEVFDLSHTLSKSKEVKKFLTRVNLFLITNGQVKAEFKTKETIGGYSVFYRVIDLAYILNITNHDRLPLEIDFQSDRVEVPCIGSNENNELYHSYLAIVPGNALASIYEKYGPRLLEQNVRSFLQFSGKINKGIRKTILDEPHMFLAFNNGIAATAESVEIIDTPQGKAIGKVKDFQIVNGGQTTASIYHTWKKNKVDISKVFVQLKLNIINDKENFAETVGRIAEYANTQNRISASDLSSNKENHVILEKLSRTTFAAPKDGELHQTRWFYERSRGQYRNEKNRFGTTPARRKQFDKQNPRTQLVTKEFLAKYINSYKEVASGKKILIGPHIVVKGSQKNYAQFLMHNFKNKPDQSFYEDAIAQAILFKTAEKIYGVKPNALGDMRYITVPYAIAWLGYRLEYKLNLHKIWKKQEISSSLKEVIKLALVCIEKYIKEKADGSLYGEWAKKEVCWQSIKSESFDISLEDIKEELYTDDDLNKRYSESLDYEEYKVREEVERIKSVNPETWGKIESWGRLAKSLSTYQGNIAYRLSRSKKHNGELSEVEIRVGNEILDVVVEQASELLFDVAEDSHDEVSVSPAVEISPELVESIVKWDKKNRRLQDFEFIFMLKLMKGEKELNDYNKSLALKNYYKVKRFGFKLEA
ncbi:AIPR family protein [Roseivirga sp. BDSF3-8]|uniref:AIPR family protein n=1 Tax=Roseivirga sp. BDSF3-8 TaxID=3241598 RepID=UPI003531C685